MQVEPGDKNSPEVTFGHLTSYIPVVPTGNSPTVQTTRGISWKGKIILKL